MSGGTEERARALAAWAVLALDWHVESSVGVRSSGYLAAGGGALAVYGTLALLGLYVP